MRDISAGVKLTGLVRVQARKHVNSALRDRGFPFELTGIKADKLNEFIASLDDIKGGKHGWENLGTFTMFTDPRGYIAVKIGAGKTFEGPALIR